MENSVGKKILLVDTNAVNTYVCSIEDGILKEFYSESQDTTQITGNIYKGRVQDVVDGLQSAFVDIDTGKNGFWYIGETLVHNTVLGNNNALPHIIHAKPGDYVMVQAIKEGTELKGPKLTSNISIPGHYLIYLFNLDFVGVSNKILDINVRGRLTSLISGLAPKGRGFIARTASATASDDEIMREAEFLIKAGDVLQRKWEETNDVSLIHNEVNLLNRSIRDMLTDKTDCIVCNSGKMAGELRQMVSDFCPYFKGTVELYDKSEDIFDYYNIADDIWQLNEPRVDLPFGGFIVIEKTEALTTIDVNTGKYIGEKDREDTVYRTNLLAVKEIARQIRLRNIGGIIVVDFIDMYVEEHKSNIVDALKDELFYDRVKTRVLDMSGLGLVEISRKKIGNEIKVASTNKCPMCGGTGQVITNDSLSRMIKLNIKKAFAASDCSVLFLKVRPEFAEYVLRKRIFSNECRGLWAEKRIYLILAQEIGIGKFELEEGSSDIPVGSVLLQ